MRSGAEGPAPGPPTGGGASETSGSAPLSLRSLAAPIAAISTFGISLSMSFPIFALLLERMGASGTVIGLNTMAAAISTVIFAPLMPLILRRVGLGPLMVGSALLIVLVFLAIPVWHDLWFWSVLRLVYGFAATALFFTSEFWIVGAAPADRRGRIVAVYGIVLSAAFMTGPMIVRLIGVDGIAIFLAGAAATLAGVLPILWGLPVAPDASGERPPRLRDALGFYISDPALIWAVVLFGSIEFGSFGLVSVWGIRAGLAPGDAVLLLSAFALGSVLLQIPIGWAADRFAPRAILATAGLAVALLPLAMVAAAPSLMVLTPLVMLWGGMATGLYTIALTALGSRYTGERLAAATAAIILGYGIGALVASPLLGAAMDAVDPHGLHYAGAVFALAYLVLVGLRLIAGRRSNAP